MPRPIWSGAISFGLVNVPVKLFSAVSKKDIHFHQLHAADGVRVRLKHVCPADGEEIPFERLVKGYEIAPDSYVIVTPEELEALDPKASRTIEITDFAAINEIDPLYFDHSYFLVPETSAVKAYALLHRAMVNTGKVAIATVVIRGKQYLTLIRPSGQALSLTTLLYADEVVSVDALENLSLPVNDFDERELSLAEQIVTSQTTGFDLSRYRDDHRLQVMELIERKAAGQEVITAAPAEAAGAKVIDLMEALEESLAAAKRSAKGKGTDRGVSG